MPAPVLAAIREHLELEARIGGYEASAARQAAVQATYGAVAELLGCRPANVALVENATVAFALALSAVPFAAGDQILTSRNDYVSNQIMFLALARRFGIEVVRAPDDALGGVDPGAVAELLRRERPRLVAMTHVPTSSGLVQPLAEVGKLCQELEVPFLVDACQSVGQQPIDVLSLGCDFLSATSRKFLRGPRGAGFLYVSDRALEAGWEPLFPDMRGAHWTAPDTYELEATAHRFENWEFSYALVLGTGEAVRYALDLGLSAIAERSRSLAAFARQRLREIDGVRVLDRGKELCAIITLDAAGWTGDALHDALEQRGINTSVSRRAFAQLDFADKGVDWALRVSPHYYNTEAEIEMFVATLADLQRQTPSRPGPPHS